MTKIRSISKPSEIRELRAAILSAADLAVSKLKALLEDASSIGVFKRIRFHKVGCDPLDPSRPLNLVEQLNQTFTYLTTLEAAEWLLARHRRAAPFVLNLGTTGGPDIVSADKQVVAEVFAAVRPQNNGKLRKDINKVAKIPATYRYAFFACPNESAVPTVADVNGIPVTIVQLKMFYECISDPSK